MILTQVIYDALSQSILSTDKLRKKIQGLAACDGVAQGTVIQFGVRVGAKGSQPHREAEGICGFSGLQRGWVEKQRQGCVCPDVSQGGSSDCCVPISCSWILSSLF